MAAVTILGGAASNLTATVLGSLAKEAVRKAASWRGARDDLKKLENTIKMIQARVGDAERRQEDADGEVIKEWLRRLRQVLYRADDLLDEVVSLDLLKQQQQMEKSMLCKVGILFTKFGPLCYNRKLAHEIKSIREQLDAIKSDMADLNLSILPAQEPPMARLIGNRETASFVNTEDVVGRDDEKNMIIEMLLDSKYDGENITIIPIVGFGGLGKTTLAQLVFNDVNIRLHFDLIKWAYVPEKNNIRAIMEKIFYAFTSRDYNGVPLEDIKQGIRESIATNKYLLVLDDLWDEEAHRLIDLVNLLKCGKHGSKVIVTTRSDIVAKGIGTSDVLHKLGTLSDDQSWRLFKKLAFSVEQEEKNSALNAIGEEIVNMCGNVPLAIKVIAGSLRNINTEEEWSQVRDAQRSKAQLTKGDNIMGVLKLSYDYLPTTLKQCFAYCSMFPKGSWFKKDKLAQIWMAQGCFEASNEDIGGRYFSELLARNFFQNLEISDEGDVRRCKMHDLLHDLAKEVAGDEIMLLDDGSTTVQIPDGLVHINLDDSKCPPSLKVARNLRSLFGKYYDATDNKIFSRIQSLRVLSYKYGAADELLNSIGKLIHLRYLKLKSFEMEYLSGSITRLVNLQTLKLKSCSKLKELPRDFAKLGNLRYLLLPEMLTDLPPGFGKLTSLQELNVFLVGKGYGVDSLPASNLKGGLSIEFRRWRRDAIEEVKRANLKNNHQLSSLTLNLNFEEERCTPIAAGDMNESDMNEMLRYLQLPPKLKGLIVDNYKGDKMPVRWLDGLTQLVSMKVCRSFVCKVVPKLSGLPRLKSLELYELDILEYVEEEDEDNIRVGTASVTHNNNRCFFPSLEVLKLTRCYNLKGWRKSTSKDNGEQRQVEFPRLFEMRVTECPMLLSVPQAPKLESLYVCEINWKMVECGSVRSNDGNEEAAAALSSSAPSSSSSSSSYSTTLFTSLKKLEITLVDDGLISLSIGSSMCNASAVNIRNCCELRNMRFESSNSLREISMDRCDRLESISEGLRHLSGLERLDISNCYELELGKSGSGWQGMSSLRQLILQGIPKVETLPGGIGCVTTLQQLNVIDMMNLREIPEEIGNLSLLRELSIKRCPKVKSLPPSILGLPMLKIEGCRGLGKKNMPGGEGWHLIQHIPNLHIHDGLEEYEKIDNKEV